MKQQHLLMLLLIPSQLQTLVLIIMDANTFVSREAAVKQLVLALLTTSWKAMERTAVVNS